jgi:hypothetical protein
VFIRNFIFNFFVFLRNFIFSTRHAHRSTTTNGAALALKATPIESGDMAAAPAPEELRGEGKGGLMRSYTSMPPVGGKGGQSRRSVPETTDEGEQEQEQTIATATAEMDYHPTYPGHPVGVYLEGTVMIWVSEESAPNGISHGYISVHSAQEKTRQKSPIKYVIVFHQWIPRASQKVGARVHVRVCGEETAGTGSTPRVMAVCRECDWPKMYNRRSAALRGPLYHEWLALREAAREEVRVTLLREQRELREMQRDAALRPPPSSDLPPPYTTITTSVARAPPAPAGAGAGKKSKIQEKVKFCINTKKQKMNFSFFVSATQKK